ncbi:MAG: 3-oxoacyl-[acyl-carrier-protein] synthase III [Planctomycetota bacterium]|jgi:3-oxoacyl-[acyl-carrier-protein] synthase III
MRFHGVRIAGLGHDVSNQPTTSEELEERLAPLYDRLRLRVGRLELMSGIRERRFYAEGERPSAIAARAGEKALADSDVAREDIGLLIHASVCRDFLEPATASVVHANMGLSPTAQVFDLSNACLGVMNGIVIAARLIESGEIKAALIVSGEDGRGLVEQTIQALNADQSLTRDSIKSAFASLTIGSGGAAVVLARAEEGDDRGRVIGGALLAATEHNVLCQGDRTEQVAGPLMSTDSEAMLIAGNELAGRTFELMLQELHWTRADIQRVITHQVGSTHRRLLFETVGLDMGLDFPTVETLGNTGSAAVPTAFSMAVQDGFITRGQKVALLGIGSGLNCLMLGIRW